MTELIRINDEVVTADGFVKLLKLTGRYDGLIEDVIKDRLAIHAARRQGIEATPDEIQERADQIRRIRGLHRAADTNKWLDRMHISLEEFEQFIIDMLLHEKVMEEVLSDAAVEEYFQLHSPKFEAIEVSHILVDSEGTARELIAILEDEPEMFPELAREHSLADTRDEGGYVGKVMRGMLAPEIEAKVFNAEEGEVLGPFPAPDELHFEIFHVTGRRPAVLDAETGDEVRRLLREEWLGQQAREHALEIL